jgi:hypothetical protein
MVIQTPLTDQINVCEERVGFVWKKHQKCISERDFTLKKGLNGKPAGKGSLKNRR